MSHWIKSRNLPFSIEYIKNMTISCSVRVELKSRFNKPQDMHLIKVTTPFKTLDLGFKGPLPSQVKNKNILTITDAYSRFPFVYACSDLTENVVIETFFVLFSLFGTPSYIHSDRGTTFMFHELKTFLHSRRFCNSRTTLYNPRGNRKPEKLNKTLWNTISID